MRQKTKDARVAYILDISLNIIQEALQKHKVDIQRTLQRISQKPSLSAKKVSQKDKIIRSKDITTQNKQHKQQNTNNKTTLSVSNDIIDFYNRYKDQLTDKTPISEQCVKYYDKIDAIAKKHDFPTALIIATRRRENTCKFENPGNER